MNHPNSQTLRYDLQRFADGSVVNTTTGQVNAYTGVQTPGMTAAMKTFYDTELLENARDEAVYSPRPCPRATARPSNGASGTPSRSRTS